MKLTQEPEIVTWSEMHYVFVEKIGPFMTSAPEASRPLHKLTEAIAEHNTITGYTSLYPGARLAVVGVSQDANSLITLRMVSLNRRQPN